MPTRRSVVTATATVVLALAGPIALGCGGSSPPSAPTSLSSAQAATASNQPFTIELPIAPGDSVAEAYGIWPYGVHGSSHALDGHPGFDIEYRVGAPVLAAADGTIDTVIADAHDPSRRSVQLRHVRDRGIYLTTYTNLLAVPDRFVAGAVVSLGERLGIAGSFAGGLSAMTHFQVGDPTHLENGTIIASPAGYLTAAARAQLDDIWRTAAYIAELCEPLLANSRAHGFPFDRGWTRQSGSGPVQFDVTCPADGVDPQYVLTADGANAENGVLRVGWSTRPGTLDFLPSSGPSRLGLYDIVGDTMRMAVGAPGAPRPASLAGAAAYTTK